MCTQSSESMIKEETIFTDTKPSRKSRTKIRKPKFLSLRLQLSPEKTQMPTSTAATRISDHDRHHQLNLFPLHPENLVEEKDMIALFTAGESAATTTLTGLLEEEMENHQSPSSVEYGYAGDGREEGDRLVRTAMRNCNRERDVSEEKWVCYSEVVEMKEEEVMSSGGGGGSSRRCDYGKDKGQIGLSLKLDYQKIMNAWSDKGPLYIQLDSPQTVPDLRDDDFLSSPNGLSHGWESGNGAWSVPEITVKDEAVGWEDGMNMSIDKRGRREASMLRYKEKRQNRLFAKTIRYQVRKLNAEKRPRVKGRFVKAG